MSKDKNVNNLIMNILPDNRPITSLQIVEDYEKCPKNFIAIHRTYDQDADADLWRKYMIIGKKSGRYLCLSKSEGLPDYVVETLKVIGDRELPPEGFSLLSRTADTEQKAWRNRQIAYKLSKRGSVTQAVTDVILCSKLKLAPEGFVLAGEVNGIVVCFKSGPVSHRPPPNPPTLTSDLDNSLHYMNISTKPLYPTPPAKNAHDYEEIQASYRLPTPARIAPKPPTLHTQHSHSGTLSGHSELDGVPFCINPNLTQQSFEMPKLKEIPVKPELDYNFQLERQILCTLKSSKAASRLSNPFYR
ncbi:hypothetical protein HA402_012885 [Bradysia odoriphaga]|nr:hypothetical protein HA402_012885 [Bradysia odoriphaga]